MQNSVYLRAKSCRELEYIKAFRTRHGKGLLYFRRRGHPANGTPLPTEDWDQFIAAYNGCLNGTGAPPIVKAPRNARGTWGAVIEAFRNSRTWDKLRPNSRRVYESKMRFIAEEFGSTPVADLGRKAIKDLIDTRARVATGAANDLRATFKALIKQALADEVIDADPMVGIAKEAPVNQNGHYPWSEENVAQYQRHHKLGGLARLVLEIPLNTGLRISDVVVVGPRHISKNGSIVITPKKTQKFGKVVEIPMHPDLAAALAATPTLGLETWVVSTLGRGITESRLGQLVRGWVAEAGLPTTGPQKLTLHGLRKRIVIRLLEAGCSPHQVAAITGHSDIREVERYGKLRDQAKMGVEAFRKLAEKGVA